LRTLLSYLILLFFICDQSYAQQGQLPSSTIRIKRLSVSNLPVVIDSLPIVPNSVYFDILLSPECYEINYATSVLIWKQKATQNFDSVTIHYRVFPLQINATSQRKNYNDYRFNFLSAGTLPSNVNEKVSSPFSDLQTIQTDGSIGRTLIVGNNQDVVLNAAMNLQMKGMIGDSLEFQALITDNNLPVQPEGNTKDLKDLDRIYLQVKKNNWQMELGDLDLKSEQLRYLKFYKRIQGAGYQFKTSLSKSVTQSTKIQAAVAKGKFNRNNIVIIEGNQGPYRLKGANNELYFVVLAGTERVFADGVLLRRGADEDYVINYNTAEITFTPQFQVSKDTRLQVEFEYADRNYLNTQFFLSHEMNIKDKLNIQLGVFSNQDSKNTSIDQDLDGVKKKFIAAVGDSIQQAYYHDAYRDTLAEGKILYKKIDTVYQINLHDSVYVYSINPNDVLFALNFTFVGQGKGNYRQQINAGNGKIYQWIAPSSGNVKQGDYEPVVLLVTPKMQQLFTLSTHYHPTSRTELNVDLALSRNDINLFATKDKSNDWGFAGNLRIKTKLASFNISGRKHQLDFDGGYERISEGFKTIERFRNVEFYRDWSLGNVTTMVKETYSDMSMKLSGKGKNVLQYGLVSYTRADGYNGLSHRMIQHYEDSSWKMDLSMNMLQFQNLESKGNFIRPGIDINKSLQKFGGAKLHLQALAEINQIRIGVDSMLPTAFAFTRYEVALQTRPEKEIGWGLKYFTRRDWRPDGHSLQVADQSQNVTGSFTFTGNPNHYLSVSAGWRTLKVIQSSISGQTPDQALVGKIDYNFNWFQDLIKGALYYELGGGQEQKRDYAFLAVPVGQGNYTWIDYNGNGIEELNEFELALYEDQKKYIRIQVPGTQYNRVNSIQLNYNLDIDPSVIIQQQKGLISILRHINASSSMQISRKQLATAGVLFDPGFNTIADTNLVSLSTAVTHVLYINRLSSKWGIDISFNQSRNRSLYIYGFEDRKLQTLQCRGRWNINKSFVFTTSALMGEQGLSTTGFKFENRNYRISKQKAEAGITYLFKNKFRASLNYDVSNSKNLIDSMEKLHSGSFQAELKYNLPSTTSIGIKWSIRQLDYQSYAGAAQTPVGFVLLDGLQPGSNQLWSIDLMKRMAKNMELSLQYDGRNLSSGKVIHTGRASIRALF